MDEERLATNIDGGIRSLGILPPVQSAFSIQENIDFTACSSQQLGQTLQYFTQQFAYVCYQTSIADAKATHAELEYKRKRDLFRDKLSADIKKASQWQIDAKADSVLSALAHKATVLRTTARALESVKTGLDAKIKFISREITRREAERETQNLGNGWRGG